MSRNYDSDTRGLIKDKSPSFEWKITTTLVLVVVGLVLTAVALAGAWASFAVGHNASAGVASLQAVSDNSPLGAIQTTLNALSDSFATFLTSFSAFTSSFSTFTSSFSTFKSTQCIPITALTGAPITTSGVYCLTASLVCTLTTGTCLPVQTPGVTIDMRGFNITVNPTTTAISLDANSNGFTLRNGVIITSPMSNSTSSHAISATSTQRVTFEHVRMTEFFRTIIATNVKNWRLIDVHIDNTPRPGIGVTKYWGYFPGCQGLTIEDSTFTAINPLSDLTENGFGLYFRGYAGVPARGLAIRRSRFTDSMIFCHNTAGVNGGNHGPNSNTGIVIEDSTLEITDPTFPNALAYFIASLDPTSPSQPLSDITLRRNKFINLSPGVDADGIIFGGVGGVLMEDNVFDLAQNGNDPDNGLVDVAAIHIGITATYTLYGEDFSWMTQNGITIRKNVFRSGNRTGVNGEATVTANQLMGHAVIIEPGSSDVSFIDNDVSGVAAGAPNGDGVPSQQPAAVLVMGGTKRITIAKNRISGGSCATGSYTVPADGIRVMGAFSRASLVDASSNSWPAPLEVTLDENTLVDNCGNGIYNRGNNTMIINNKLNHNGVNIDSTPSAVTVTIGSAAVAGGNLVM